MSKYKDREHIIELPCPAFRPLALNPVIPGIAGTRFAGEMAYNLKIYYFLSVAAYLKRHF